MLVPKNLATLVRRESLYIKPEQKHLLLNCVYGNATMESIPFLQLHFVPYQKELPNWFEKLT
jgi:hypothetical protein